MLDKELYIRDYCNKLYVEYVDINQNEMNIIYDFIVNNINKLPDNPTSNMLLYFGLKNYSDKNYDKMSEYYLKSIELNNSNAMYYYGSYFEHTRKAISMMKKYYKMAIELNNVHAMNALAVHYTYSFSFHEQKEAEKYFLMAIELGDVKSLHHLGQYYTVMEQYDKMKKYYLMSIELGNTKSMISLGNYYRRVEKDFIKMREYLDKAIEHGNFDAVTIYEVYYIHYMSTTHFNEYLELILLTKCKFDDDIINIKSVTFNDETHKLLNKIPNEYLTKELIIIKNIHNKT